jgi:3,4-dihydroxy 2-butanone 4-phosphate synthase/GTP cyclohydrolase II
LARIRKSFETKGNLKAPQIKMDNKDFGIGAQILHSIDISSLLSNTDKIKELE